MRGREFRVGKHLGEPVEHHQRAAVIQRVCVVVGQIGGVVVRIPVLFPLIRDEILEFVDVLPLAGLANIFYEDLVEVGRSLRRLIAAFRSLKAVVGHVVGAG